MGRSYYVIELSARWLTVLLVALALLMVLAFGLGFGAARSAGGDSAEMFVESVPTPLINEVVIPDQTPVPPVQTPTGPVSTPTPRPMPPTAIPPTAPPATATPKDKPKQTATPRPAAQADGFSVQLLASLKQASIEEARARLAGLGFDREHQQVVRSEVAGGATLHKLRVGPFPDRASADRVVQRMRDAGFPDAWVVAP
jgi:cell division septation protein DedD